MAKKIIVEFSGWDDDDSDADASLIAAAPDLLSVARMAFDYAQDTKARFIEYFDFDDEESYDNLCDACEKAIDKAERYKIIPTGALENSLN